MSESSDGRTALARSELRDASHGWRDSLLVVDADAGTTRGLGDSWIQASFPGGVRESKSFDEAIAEVTQRRPAAVLLNLGDRGGDGLVGLARLRALAPGVPIVAVADADDESLAVEAIQQGAQECLVKNQVEPRGLARTLRHAIERQRILLELEAARQREQYLATHDALTGVPNRTLFYDRLAQAIAFASRYGKQLAVLFLDLDGFKPINDSLGHTVGDRLLREVAERLCGAVRKSDTVARIGGDEFTLLLTQILEPANAARVANNILSAVAQPVHLGSAQRSVKASIGISIYPIDGEVADTLVRNADVAMYEAKRNGGNRHVFFRPEMRSSR